MATEIIKKEIDMGPGPILGGLWRFSILPEPLLTTELARLSRATTKANGDTDIVSLQPCQAEEAGSQDRYVIQDLDLPGGVWRLRAVFDGHAGHETVDHVSQTLPNILETSLCTALTLSPTPTPPQISTILRESITSIDESILAEFLKFFPDVETITNGMKEEEIKALLSEDKEGNEALVWARRALSGTTVLVSLTDPRKENIWVASLGDCQAVLGIQNPTSWKTTILSTDHNGTDKSETARIRTEHPNELDCMLSNRVLGAIAVTRAIGDFMFKLPKEYTQRVFIHLIPNPDSKARVLNYIERNLTPPYLSNVAEVRHFAFPPQDKDKIFLILCSDGLTDLYEEEVEEPLPGTTIAFPNERSVDIEEVGRVWMGQIGRALHAESAPSAEEADASADKEKEEKNLALVLLKQAMGAREDNEAGMEKVCRLLTAERKMRWMDDTTILVQRL